MPSSLQQWIGLLRSVCITSGLIFLGGAFAFGRVTQEKQNFILLNHSFEKRITPGEFHTYFLSLESEQYAQLSLSQSDIGCSITLYSPTEQKISEAVSLQPHISISIVAKASGRYRVAVRTTANSPPSIWYELRLKELRSQQPQDKLRLWAANLFAEGENLRSEAKASAYRLAIRQFEKAGAYWHHLGDKNSEAVTLIIIGDILQNLGELKKSLVYFNRALAISEQLGDKLLEADSLNGSGYSYIFLNEEQKAYHAINKALSLCQSHGYKPGEAKSLLNFGEFNFFYRELNQARDSCKQALSRYEAIDSFSGQAQTLLTLCSIYLALSDKENASQCYEKALSLYQTMGHRRGEALALMAGADLNVTMGDIQEAIILYDKAISLLQRVGDKMWETSASTGLGYIYEEIGDEKLALINYQRATKLYKEIGMRQGETFGLIRIGKLYSSMGQQQQALSYFLRAEKANHLLNDKSVSARLSRNIGTTWESLGRRKEAFAHYYKALELNRMTGLRREVAYDLNSLGNLYFKTGETQKALEYFNEALQTNREAGDKFGEISTLYNLAHVECDASFLEAAIIHITEVIKLSESLRNELKGPELRTTYFAPVQKSYDLYIDLLMQQHKQNPNAKINATALEMSEKARARTLVESLLESRANIGEGVDVELLQREKELQKKIAEKAAYKDQLLSKSNTGAQVKATEEEMGELFTELQITRSLIRAANPRYGALTASQSLTTTEIQSLLDNDTLLLEYRLGDERSYLWAVSSTSITSFELPARKVIEDEVLRLYQALTESGDAVRGLIRPKAPLQPVGNAVDYRKPAARLGQLLLAPLASQLQSKRLVIVADGALQYINFAALSVKGSGVRGQESEKKDSGQKPELAKTQDSGLRTENSPPNYQPLLLEHEIIHLPSAAVLAVLRRQFGSRPPANKSVAVIADPVFDKNDERLKPASRAVHKPPTTQAADRQMQRTFNEILARNNKRGIDRLIFSYREAEAILQAAKAHPTMQALGFEASREKILRAELSAYRFVHFATHGFLNNENPDLSGIVLSLYDARGNQQNGYLRLADICGLKLNAELVVLSACQTGLGKEFRGEGLMGLTRGFMQAGAMRVVASLWNVNDKATAELMKRFYEKLLVENMRPAEALRSAQIEIFKTKRWQSPYYWAGFTLQGEWK